MKKIASLVLTLMFCTVLCVPAFAESDIEMRFQVDGKSVYSLSQAFYYAKETGSVITQIGDDNSVYLAEESIDITNDVTLICGKGLDNTFRRIEFSGGYQPLFTVKNGGKLTLRYSEIRLCDTDIVGNGKLILVEQGGTLVLDGTENEPVTFLDSSDSSGLILVQSGGKILFYGATFKGNQSDENIKINDGGVIINDLNGDRIINGSDFYRLAKYLESPETYTVSAYPDFNLDGNVNHNDLLLLLEHLAQRGPDPEAVDISDKSEHSVSVSPDKNAHFLFAPKENANCTFVLPKSEESKLWYILYDNEGNLIDSSYYSSGDEGKDGTFEISADFDSNKQYYFEIGTGTDSEITFNMNIPLPPQEAEGDTSAELLSSTLSEGSLTIIVGIVCFAVGFVIAMFIFKKKTQST